MTPEHLEVYLAAEGIVDAFTRDGNLEPSAVKDVYPQPDGRPPQLEWMFGVPAGSLLAVLYAVRRDGALLPALNVEVGIATLVPGSRRQTLRFCLETNRLLDGLARVSLADDLIVVSIGAVVTRDNLDFVKTALFRLPSAAADILGDLGRACEIKPWRKQEARVLHG